MHVPLLVFTDLDGTLLDHHTYSFNGAGKTLERLRRSAIPLVLTSSKTKAELLKLQGLLGLSEPFISENGGGLFLPPGYPLPVNGRLANHGRLRCRLFGLPYSYIRNVFAGISPEYGIRGFGDMTVEEIMAHTGLSREDAILAGKRDFSEPFLFLGKPRPGELREEVAALGLAITRGGRFYHMLAAGQNKGRAVAEAIELFQDGHPDRPAAVGLGDAANDYSMLKAVDIPVLIPKPDGSYEKMELPGLRRAPYPGSKGWGIVVAGILDEFERRNP